MAHLEFVKRSADTIGRSVSEDETVRTLPTFAAIQASALNLHLVPSLAVHIFRIRDVMIRIRICSFLQWLSRCQQKISFISKFLLLITGTYCRYIYISLQIYLFIKKLQNCTVEIIVFLNISACLWKDPEPDPDSFQ